MFVLLICISELGLECDDAGRLLLIFMHVECGTLHDKTRNLQATFSVVINGSVVYVVEMIDLMLRELSTKQGNGEGDIARCHGHSCRGRAVKFFFFFAGPKVTWLLNCAVT
jgi:hypothetical protein